MVPTALSLFQLYKIVIEGTIKRQYLLEKIVVREADAIQLRLSVVCSGVKNRYTAIVERLDVFELKSMGRDEICHAQIWVIDDFANELVRNVSADSEAELVEVVSLKLRQHIGG